MKLIFQNEPEKQLRSKIEKTIAKITKQSPTLTASSFKIEDSTKVYSVVFRSFEHNTFDVKVRVIGDVKLNEGLEDHENPDKVKTIGVKGAEQVKSNLDLAIERGIVTRVAAYYTFEGDRVFKKENFLTKYPQFR